MDAASLQIDLRPCQIQDLGLSGAGEQEEPNDRGVALRDFLCRDENGEGGDASDSLIMALGGMLPRPPSVIRRSAVIHVGDY